MRAVRSAPRPEISTAARPASPTSAGTTAASTRPASAASSCSSDASEEGGAEVPAAAVPAHTGGAGAAAMLATLRWGCDQLATLAIAGLPLDAALCGEVHALAAELLRLAPLPGAGTAATGAAAARAVPATDLENAAPLSLAASAPALVVPVCGGGGAPWAADMEAMRRLILADVRAQLRAEAAHQVFGGVAGRGV